MGDGITDGCRRFCVLAPFAAEAAAPAVGARAGCTCFAGRVEGAICAVAGGEQPPAHGVRAVVPPPPVPTMLKSGHPPAVNGHGRAEVMLGAREQTRKRLQRVCSTKQEARESKKRERASLARGETAPRATDERHLDPPRAQQTLRQALGNSRSRDQSGSDQRAGREGMRRRDSSRGSPRARAHPPALPFFLLTEGFSEQARGTLL